MTKPGSQVEANNYERGKNYTLVDPDSKRILQISQSINVVLLFYYVTTVFLDQNAMYKQNHWSSNKFYCFWSSLSLIFEEFYQYIIHYFCVQHLAQPLSCVNVQEANIPAKLKGCKRGRFFCRRIEYPQQRIGEQKIFNKCFSNILG